MPTAALPKPRSTKAEVLHGLITNLFITGRDYDMTSFRTRISDLRLKHSLNVRDKEVTEQNKHHHSMTYKRYYLWLKDRKKAIRLYNKINQA